MHSRQASLLRKAEDTISNIHGATPKQAGAALWKYVDPTGGEFFITAVGSPIRTVHSPFTGKTFTAKPIKMTVSQLGGEVREEGKPGGAEPV